jgi:hypothetical protein
MESGWLSRFSYELLSERLGFDSEQKIFLSSTAPRAAVRSTYPIQWVQLALYRG